MSSDGSTVLFRALPDPIKLSLSEKHAVRTFARTLGERLAARRAFTCLISNDRELRELNRKFRRQDRVTDVLSFPASAGHSEAGIGEIAISTERATVQARSLGHQRIDEMRILMLHGILHLAGMDHERDHGEMARAERKWRLEFGLPETLLVRSGSPGALQKAAAR